MKKAEFIKSYVNGKKSAFYNVEGNWWLLSYVRGWGYWKEEIPFKNRKGFFAAEQITRVEGVELTVAIEIAADLHGGPVYLEGSEEYEKIRAEVEAKGRRAKRVKKAEEAPKQETPKQEAPKPAPAPKPRKDGEVRDPNFEYIKRAVMIGRNVYLWGPAGSGKTTIAEQVAEELGLPFYCQGIINDKYELEGSQDPQVANGYIPSTFYKAFSEGGLYCLDEMDGCDPCQLVFLNNALANGVAVFPIIGMVRKHPDFRFIATGNTNGFGPTEMYQTRFAFDSSTMDRLMDVIRVDYDRRVERAAAGGNMEVVDFVRDLRKALDKLKCGQIVCGYRMLANLAEGAKVNDVFGEALQTARQAVEFSVMRGINGDMVRMIAEQINESDNQFTAALKEYAAVAI